jgi:hypothetical protein
MKIALQAGFGGLLAVLGAAVGWGVWEGRTTVLQVLVLACVATYGAVGWVASRDKPPLEGMLLSYGGAYRAVAMFIAGAAIGALAYHGEIALLYAALWAGMLIWVERMLRSRLGDAIGDIFDWL